MAKPHPRNSPPNPFYVVLLAASTAFAVTAWVGYIGPLMAKGPAPGDHRALADWFDRRGTTALVIELAVMTASALLAMVTDRWFSVKSDGGRPRNPPSHPS